MDQDFLPLDFDEETLDLILDYMESERYFGERSDILLCRVAYDDEDGPDYERGG